MQIPSTVLESINESIIKLLILCPFPEDYYAASDINKKVVIPVNVNIDMNRLEYYTNNMFNEILIHMTPLNILYNSHQFEKFDVKYNCGILIFPQNNNSGILFQVQSLNSIIYTDMLISVILRTFHICDPGWTHNFEEDGTTIYKIEFPETLNKVFKIYNNFLPKNWKQWYVENF